MQRRHDLIVCKLTIIFPVIKAGPLRDWGRGCGGVHERALRASPGGGVKVQEETPFPALGLVSVTRNRGLPYKDCFQKTLRSAMEIQTHFRWTEEIEWYT